MSLQLNSSQILEQRQQILMDAQALLTNPDATAEDDEKAQRMMEDAAAMLARSDEVKFLEQEIQKGTPQPQGETEIKGGNPFDNFGEFLRACYAWKFSGPRHPALEYISPGGSKETKWTNSTNVPPERKQLVENVGSSGGFLVFPEYRPQLMMMTPFGEYVRERATVLPMGSRQLIIPTLDQTNTTAGQTNFFGGVIPIWTAEATEKEAKEPEFRQAEFIAHKLVVYTEASDELLSDSEIPLASLLTSLMSQAIGYELDYTYIQGTGAGQPLGVVPAGATFRQPRQVANQINFTDITYMLSHFIGQSPVWIAHQATLPQLMNLQAPAGNPSLVWVDNIRDGVPNRLAGYPVYFIENCPTLGNDGDIILADWSKYIIGQRQQITIDSSKHYKFRDDLTVWRAVARFAGRPWLSTPITLRQGTHRVSPFVILAGVEES